MKNAIVAVGSVMGGLIALSSPNATAQDLANDVVRCGEIDQEAARLRCFDALIPEARKSEVQRQAEAAAKSKADFGLTAIQRNEAAQRKHPKEKSGQRVSHEGNLRIEAAIADLDMSPYGTVFVLDNNQVWQTTSFGGLSTVPRIGQKVTVESGPLGGYRLTLAGKTREVGVKRVK
ncbi:hypothetical protein KNJ79_03055 [Sphingopyxis indica]|uniref:hypothetical protein n=1 Tax=Sphingopyxis indica TaxID=436663 RepID=UPI0029394A44|nr:hypothetical protein [Sphingopyxis indica]WOF43948.1 hypothetical protein KNJ79_03055 [Sphingopyxis indica]